MKYLAYYCLFFLARQIVHIWQGSAGNFSVWLSLLYAAILAFILALPFKKEFKLVWLTLLTLDAVAPLAPFNALRIFGLAVATLWLCTFCWRRFFRKDALSPWAEERPSLED